MFKNQHRTYTLEEAKRKLEKYCVYQERCHFEINKKMAEMRMIPEAQLQIITHLIAHDFLNEERFARAFARGKFKIKSWGKQRIIRELKARDISVALINIALSEIDANAYLTTFDALSLKQSERISGTNTYKKRKKLADFLAYRGWESDLIYPRVRELFP